MHNLAFCVCWGIGLHNLTLIRAGSQTKPELLDVFDIDHEKNAYNLDHAAYVGEQ